MSTDPRIDAYFDRWNAHDGAGLAGLFAPGGTYEDPSTRTPVPASGIPALVDRICLTFPDLRFEKTSETGSEHRSVVEWILRGTFSGAFIPGISPTHKSVELRGVDVLELDASGIRSVRGYFDQKTLVEKMGLMSLVQPLVQGPASFGYSMRVASGNPKAPGVIALTWILGRDDAERERIRGHSRQIVQDFLKEPGFIGIVTGFSGDRGFTVTAWEDEGALQRALSHRHRIAMNELRTENFVPGVWTSVWKPARVNSMWGRCPACHGLEDVSDGHRICAKCGHELPARPTYW